jgi:hypothetical protein
MAWVWDFSDDSNTWGADIDYKLSTPFTEIEALSDGPIDPRRGRPTFKSRSGIKRFKALHSPPIGIRTSVDPVWRDIILKFVPADRIQFLPIRLIARGEVCDDYTWVIPFDRVNCIDMKKSDISRTLEKNGKTMIFGVRKFIHIEGCLGSRHLARDEQLRDHVVVSDQLMQALAATGERSMFRQPEDVITLDRILHENRMKRLN